MILNTLSFLISHPTGMARCYQPITQVFVKHTESSQQDKTLGANLYGSQQTLLEQNKIHTLGFFLMI